MRVKMINDLSKSWEMIDARQNNREAQSEKVENSCGLRCFNVILRQQ